MNLQHRTCEPCDESKLAVLLSADEHSDEYSEVAKHLQSCQGCQTRLTQLVADDPTWQEVTNSLGDCQPPYAKEENQLSRLMQPSHPEMLGRLGRYEVESMIGSGGMGVVVKGLDTELNRPVAIKLLAQHLAHNGAARQRFAREARAAAAVVHEHVVAIHDIQSDAETPFMVMQYVPGESLQTRVERQGPLGVKEILRIGMQAASGLAAAHAQGVVHRDVKPANILLEHGVERTLLTDFGLARVADDATVTRTGILAGTPNYMSPEQASGEAVDHRSDLFSLGAALYFAATGRPPFRAERAMAVLHQICNDPHRSAWERNPEIPDELSDIFDRMLQKKPGRRFETAEQVGHALSGLLVKLQQTGVLRRRTQYQRWANRYGRPFVYGWVALAMVAVASARWLYLPEIPSTLEQPRQPSVTLVPPPPAGASPVLSAEIFPASEYLTEMVEIKNALGQLELHSKADTAVSNPTVTDDEWYHEISTAKHRLSITESLMNITNSPGEK